MTIKLPPIPDGAKMGNLDCMRPKSLIPPEDWLDFCEWARDGGYDQSYFNRWDSKSLALQQQYLDELQET